MRRKPTTIQLKNVDKEEIENKRAGLQRKNAAAANVTASSNPFSASFLQEYLDPVDPSERERILGLIPSSAGGDRRHGS